MTTALPIDPFLPDVIAALRSNGRLVLSAEPGAGKTTRVPAALLDAGLAGDKNVIVLEPRRVAARAAAEFVARQRGGSVGGEVGYRVRFEHRGGRDTRLWFLTEGVLGRQLARDPFLEEIGVAVLDEFHERHLQGDVALAVLRELQQTVRPDLRLVVMSATLETERLAAHLGNCPVVAAPGRAHPVSIEYEPQPDDRALAGKVAAAVRRLLTAEDDGGDVLVFLPGAAEIRRVAEALEPLATQAGLDVVPLHGDLPLDQQHRALRRGARRKVVLATNVAETALTIEGVTVVIDSGLARVARLDNRHGINALRLSAISQASAAQRAGRAGRTAPGRCLRLWTRAEQASRRPHEVPEILRLDLAPTVLELHAWGLRDSSSFGWLDPPPASSVQRAERLLGLLGALDDEGAVTEVGRRLLASAVHPRLGRLLVEATRRGCGDVGALLASLASERDIILEQRTFGGGSTAPWPSGPSDLLLRRQLFLDATSDRQGEAFAEPRNRRGADRAAAAARQGPRPPIRNDGKAGSSASNREVDGIACRRLGLDVGAVRAVSRAWRQLASSVSRSGADDSAAAPIRRSARGRGNEPDGRDQEADLLRCILVAFPDRVCRRRAPGSPRALMVGGTGVVLTPDSVVRDHDLFVAVDVDAGRRGAYAEARVRIASEVRREWLDELFAGAVQEVDELSYDPQGERVIARRQTRYADLVLDETASTQVDPQRAGVVLAEIVGADPQAALAPGDLERGWLGRVGFLAQWMPELEYPDPSEILKTAATFLCQNRRTLAEVRRGDLIGTLRGLLQGRQLQTLDREAPREFALPSGRTTTVHYEADKPPWVAGRIQEFFGFRSTPRLAGGRVPLVIHLLAPNGRPQQITDDLASFWRTTYADVRKQLRGRYPKHPWPEDPTTAEPTARRRK